MSRGGRRRKGKRGRRGTASPERRPGPEQEAPELDPHPAGRRRGQSRRSGGPREASVLEQMRSLPTTLQTLPPDGTVLEELIGTLQSEYGVPATPQEYRLIIKTPAPEEPTDPSLEVEPPPPETQAGPEPEMAARPRSSRRRRRRRGPGGGSAAADESVEEVVESAGPEAEDPA